ncbi:MAG TPA: von Willebrand factor type A domain-containing protein [Verrucomicrobiae bacterium]|jgi:secreted protein with Ig-like and vWFA domain|nr:von Willebrand factor type A domain-containing protein [Verrucomicrobiae bacterium]
MNPEQPSREQIEARLTALLLGELPATEAELLRFAISRDPELQKLHDQLSSTIGFVREAMKNPTGAPVDRETPLKLAQERRQKLLEHFKTARPQPENPMGLKRIKFPSTQSLAVAAIIIFVICGLAAISLPNFVKARATSQANSIINNARQIDAAKNEWALETHKPADAVPTSNDLTPYLEGNKIRSVAGEKYVLGRVSEPTVAELGGKLLSARGTYGSGEITLSEGQNVAVNNMQQTAPRPVTDYRLEAKSTQSHLSPNSTGVNNTEADKLLAANTPMSPPAQIALPKTDSSQSETDRGEVFSQNVVGYVNLNPPPAASTPSTESTFAPSSSSAPQVRVQTGITASWAKVQPELPATPIAQSATPPQVTGRNMPTPAGGTYNFANMGARNGVVAGNNSFGGGTASFGDGGGGGGGGGSAAWSSVTSANLQAQGFDFMTNAFVMGGDRNIADQPSLNNRDKKSERALSDLGLSANSAAPVLVPPMPSGVAGSERPESVHSEFEKLRQQPRREETQKERALRELQGSNREMRRSEHVTPIPANAASTPPPEVAPSMAASAPPEPETTLAAGIVLPPQPGVVDTAPQAQDSGGGMLFISGAASMPPAPAPKVELKDQARVGLPPQPQRRQNGPIDQFYRLDDEQTKTSPAQADKPLPKPPANAPIPQPEIQTRDNAFSTFSLNVSDVSFKLAMAALEKGQMPDPASIRSEEFINAFDYHDPEPLQGEPLAFACERARDPFAQERDLLRFSIKAAATGRQDGRALNLVLLLDTSGSMERADRVAIIREALRVLSSQLQPRDVVSVVTFARTARLWADGVPGDQAGATLDQVGSITPEGGTNLQEAMRLAYEVALHHFIAGGMNRVVLLTDGAANLGNVDPQTLTQKVDAERRQGIALDCFGIGWDDYNDDLLEQLSSNGDGRYAFINSPGAATTEFAAKLAGALQVAAEDVKVQVEFNPNRVTAWRQIGYAKHQLTKEQFRDNTVAAGAIASREAGNALYVIQTNPDGEGPIATVHVRYRVPGTQDVHEHSWSVDYTGAAPELAQSSPPMRLAASAAEISEWLADSPFAQEVTPDQLLNYMSGVPQIYGTDERPKQLEWLIREGKSVSGK